MSLTMRAVAQFVQAFNVSVMDRPVPTILNSTDVVVRLNAPAICGSDLHSYPHICWIPRTPLSVWT